MPENELCNGACYAYGAGCIVTSERNKSDGTGLGPPFKLIPTFFKFKIYRVQ